MVTKVALSERVVYGVHMVTKSPSTVTAALGRIIDYTLRDKRISRSEVASKLGIGRETLRRRIEGAEGFTMAELEGVAALLGSTPAALVMQAEDLAHSAKGSTLREAV